MQLTPYSRLFLDAHTAAVLMTILGLTSSFFIQVRRSRPSARLSPRIDTERVAGSHPYLLGLPLRPSYVLFLISLCASLFAYFTVLDTHPPEPDRLLTGTSVLPVIVEVSGRIETVYASAGAHMHTGDPIVQLDTRELLTKKRDIESRIHSFELNSSEAHSELSRLYRKLEDTRLEIGRFTVAAPSDGEILWVGALRDRVTRGEAVAVFCRRGL